MRRHYRNHTTANANNQAPDVTFMAAHPPLPPAAGHSQSAAPQSLPPMHAGYSSTSRQRGHSRPRSPDTSAGSRAYPYPPSSVASYASPTRSELSLSPELEGDDREADVRSESSRGRSSPVHALSHSRSRPYSLDYAGGPERTSHVRRSSVTSSSPYARYQPHHRGAPSPARHHPQGGYSQEPVYTFPPPPPPPSMPPSSNGRRYSGQW